MRCELGGLAPPRDALATGAVVRDSGEAAAGKKTPALTVPQSVKCLRGSCNPSRPAPDNCDEVSRCCGGTKSADLSLHKAPASSRRDGRGPMDKNGYVNWLSGIR